MEEQLLLTLFPCRRTCTLSLISYLNQNESTYNTVFAWKKCVQLFFLIKRQVFIISFFQSKFWCYKCFLSFLGEIVSVFNVIFRSEYSKASVQLKNYFGINHSLAEYLTIICSPVWSINSVYFSITCIFTLSLLHEYQNPVQVYLSEINVNR